MKPKEIGYHIKLWLAQPGNKHCMISSHGGPPYLLNYKMWEYMGYSIKVTFTVPADTWLIFYGPHGVPLTDPSFSRVLNGEIKPFEIIGPEQTCHNYGLWKWQGYHWKSNVVLAIMHSVGVKKIASPFLSKGSETYEKIKKQLRLNDDPKEMDLLSVRYRPYGWHTDLYNVISELQKNKYNYKYIHCNFCRGFSGNHSPTGNGTSPLKETGSKVEEYYHLVNGTDKHKKDKMFVLELVRYAKAGETTVIPLKTLQELYSLDKPKEVSLGTMQWDIEEHFRELARLKLISAYSSDKPWLTSGGNLQFVRERWAGWDDIDRRIGPFFQSNLTEQDLSENRLNVT
ncbi:MAG: hypothetical protein JRI43_00945 [Deltaproteobacteria bacterium]|nr:hypothetical protein [Deltaproteobacteria bacterium]